MDTQRDELNAIRQDLNQLMDQAASLAYRVDNLENRYEASEPKPEPEVELKLEPVEAPVEAERKAPAPPPVPLAPMETPKSKPRPKVAKTDVFTGPSARDAFREKLRSWWRKVGPREDMNWELALATWWLPRIGLPMVGIGVVLALTLAFNNLPEEYRRYARLGAGFLISFVLMASGYEFERRDKGFGRLLWAGGFGLAYFSAFATHYIQYTRIFPTPPRALLLMGIIVVIWAFVTHRRRSPLMGMAMVLLANGAIALSNATLDEPHRLGIAGLVALSVMTMFLLVKNRWYSVALLGLISTQFNAALWLVCSPGSDRALDFALAMAVLAALFLTYAIGEFLAAGPALRRAVPRSLRTLYASFNTAAFLALAVQVMHGFDFAQERTYVLYFALAAVLLMLAVAYCRFRDHDVLYPAYLTKASAICALGLAAYFDGHTLTLSLALETVILLYAARRSGHMVSRILAFAALLLTLVHGLYSASFAPHLTYGAEGYAGVAVSLLGTVVFLLAASELYRRTRWTPIAFTPGTEPFRTLGWHLELTESEGENGSPLGRLIFPLVYALAAMVLVLPGLWRLLASEHLSTGYGFAGLTIVAVAALLGNPGYVLASLLLTAAGIVTHFALWETAEDLPLYWTWATWVPLAILVEAARLNVGGKHLWPRLPKDLKAIEPLPYLYAAGLALLLLSTIFLETAADRQLFWLGILAAVTAGYAWASGSRAFALPAAAAYALAVPVAGVMLYTYNATPYVVGGILVLGATALITETRLPDPRGGLFLARLRLIPYAAYAVPVFASGCYIVSQFDPHTDGFALLALAAFLGGLSFVIHARALGLCSAGTLIWALCLWCTRAKGDTTVAYHAAALLPMLLALALERRLAWRDVFPAGIPGALVLVAAWFTGLQWAHEATNHWATSLTVLVSVIFVAHGAVFRIPVAAGLGLLSSMYITARHVLWAYDTSVLPEELVVPRIASFAILIAFWIGMERLTAYGRRHFVPDGSLVQWGQLQAALVSIVALLLVLTLERVPFLSAYFLTIAWTLGSVALFALAIVLRAHRYRYAALAILGLAMGRVLLIDTRDLSLEFRTAAFIFLGFVLLGVAAAYVYARRRFGRQWTTPPED